MRQGVRRAIVVLAVALLAWQGLAGVCAAELVFLSTGRTMTARSHRVEGDQVILSDMSRVDNFDRIKLE